MENYHENFLMEEEHLEITLELIKGELKQETDNLVQRKHALIAARKDMWEDTAHFSTDFEKMADVSQYLSDVTNRTASYGTSYKKIEKLEKLKNSPYFGRFDFEENDTGDEEKIYVGISTLVNSKTNDIYVYDWRAPISSIYYRYENGEASYQAPYGKISGKVILKRQYKIQNSELKYFFDCGIRINDEALQEVLSRNASAKMRNIVETIQKEQDIIIRDTDNELLIVQGVAGSGKTSIALHRVAFLLYEGMGTRLSSNNVLIISPNALFSKYISGVLPELGEEDVGQTTFEEIFSLSIENCISIETRNECMETIISCEGNSKSGFIRECLRFKNSKEFRTILDRYLWYFEHKMLEFEDVYYAGMVIETKQQLKNAFLNNKIGIPMAKRLKRLENKIMEKVNPLRRTRLGKIERAVQKAGGHEFEIKQFSRLLSMKEARDFSKHLHRFTEVDSLELYRMLFRDSNLFMRLARGLEIPSNIEDIISFTLSSLEKEKLSYEDTAPLLYLKLKIDGNEVFKEIRQVVIDEAQDYYPLHYEVFKLLFNDARFTVMGDYSQSIEKDAGISIYDDISYIMNKRKTVKLFLNRSYRASYEINAFAQKLLDAHQEIIPFERHEAPPKLVYEESGEQLELAVIRDIKYYVEGGAESIAVICKTLAQAKELYKSISKYIDIRILDGHDGELEKGIILIPVYMAKGLEFDAVLVYGVDNMNYSTGLDKKLLYIACTRALHRLSLYYTGEKSPFV